MPLAVVAQDFDVGHAAYQAGDYATALSVFTPLVVDGCAAVVRNAPEPELNPDLDRIFGKKGPLKSDCTLAEHLLAIMYFKGLGVPQDYVMAHMWFNIAASNGQFGSQVMRDLVESKMTPSDISEAQHRATDCAASDYQDCGLARDWWPW